MKYILFASFFLFFSCQEAKNKTTINNSSLDKSPEVSSQTRTDGYNLVKNAYFGDLHVHTSWSFDAFIYNVRTDPDDAYRFGKGEAIDHFTAGKIQNQRPLDFMAVTDHAEYLGIMKQMVNVDSPMFGKSIAKKIRSKDRNETVEAFGVIGTSMSRNEPISELLQADIMQTTWDKVVEAANDHYEPGTFTTFPAYEWTSSPTSGGNDPSKAFARNLHRNVIYKTDNVSEIPFSSFDSQNPEKLWEWMEKEKAKGIDLIAIPHNANMSDGLMYPANNYDGRPIDKKYAQLRADNEPINEVVQIKGQSMSHPILSPNDEFANFEMYAYTFAIGPPPESKPDHSYVRQAIGNGLAIESELGINPYKFGFIGSSDGHNSAGAFEEDNYFGKFGNRDGKPELRIATEGDAVVRAKYMSAAGLAGVWAEENTRESIYEAMKRKETFATSGPRIQVRFFGGYNFDAASISEKNWIENAYQLGVPMGGDLKASTQAPSFLIWAVKDPEGANLDRVQVIKSVLSEDGVVREKIYDVAWSDGAKMVDGKLSPVGNTVDVKDASYTNSIGAVELEKVWKDPDFNPNEHASYLLRVIEIPTPRWSTYDAKALGIEIPDDLDATIQERAWSSPIWYTPTQ